MFTNTVMPWFVDKVSTDKKILTIGSGIGMEVRDLEDSGYTNIYQSDINPSLLHLARHTIPETMDHIPETRYLYEKISTFFPNSPRFKKNLLRSAERQIATDGTRLAIAPEYFDVVLIKDLLVPLNAEDRLEVLKEATRVLKANGTIVIQNELNPTSNPFYRSNPPLDNADIPGLLKKIGFSQQLISTRILPNTYSKWTPIPVTQIFSTSTKSPGVYDL